jgi:hypothetical protein
MRRSMPPLRRELRGNVDKDFDTPMYPAVHRRLAEKRRCFHAVIGPIVRLTLRPYV